MAETQKYCLQVTAGPTYDESTHQLVPVNTDEPIVIDTEHLSANLHVRIENFRGLPRATAPSTCSYFSDPSRAGAALYSIAFNFTPKRPINGADLLFGNDFDRPIRDNLPPGFGAALRLVRWGIDPGLDGDVYADAPYLYGPLLSSVNALWVGDGPDDASTSAPSAPTAKPTQPHDDNDNDDDDESDTEREQDALEATQEASARAHAPLAEGGTAQGHAHRDAHGVPAAPAARIKHFLQAPQRAAYTLERGRAYAVDFYNAYLDFNELALKLPGVTLQLMRFWNGAPLRYTLKEKPADGGGSGGAETELFVVVFTLVPGAEVEAHERRWAATTEAVGRKAGTPARGGQRRAIDMAGVGGGGGGAGGSAVKDNETSPDDVD